MVYGHWTATSPAVGKVPRRCGSHPTVTSGVRGTGSLLWVRGPVPIRFSRTSRHILKGKPIARCGSAVKLALTRQLDRPRITS